MAKNETIEFKDLTEYPPEESAKGTNAYYHSCGELQQMASYAACMKRIADRKDGRLEVSYATCSAAIGRKDCPALAMREEEQKAGRAIYFISRPKLIQFNAERDGTTAMEIVRQPEYQPPPRRMSRNEVSTRSRPSTPPAQTQSKPESQGNAFADAINFALRGKQEINAQSPVTVLSSPAPTKINPIPQHTGIKPGMSLLEIARLRGGK